MFNDPVTFTTHDYAIGGKLVVGRAILDDQYTGLMRTDFEAADKLKQHLIHQLAEYMLEHKLVEFTQMDDPISFRKHIAVRAYVAPDDQVKILRLANKII